MKDFIVRKFLILLKIFLNRPLWVLSACAFLVVLHLSLDGTFIRIWHLKTSQKILEKQIESLHIKNTLIEERIQKLKQSDSRILESEARERFNLVGEKDIIFIFSNTSKDNK